MAHPALHVLILIAAIIIPGGLLAYIAWRAHKKRQAELQKKNEDPIEEIREAFRRMYPPLSLRAKEKQRRLNLYRTRFRKKSPK